MPYIEYGYAKLSLDLYTFPLTLRSLGRHLASAQISDNRKALFFCWMAGLNASPEVLKCGKVFSPV